MSTSDSSTTDDSTSTGPSCVAPLMMCGDDCVDTDADTNHCGGCDQPCAMGELCVDGACALDCAAPLEPCGMTCVDTQTDNDHCGGCDIVCDACSTCATGMCEANPAPAAPGPVMGMTMACANAELDFAVAPVNGLTYDWTGPMGATVTMGQGTAAAKIKLGGSSGQVCVIANDGCADSAPSCVDVTVSGGAPGMTTLAFTGASQEFVVPACVSKLTVELWGAQGGGAKCCDNSIQDDGGKGGYVKAELTVAPGDKLYGYVGGKGVTEGPAGWNGGGTGGQWGAGGGGATDLRTGAQQLADRVLVAGGGGGGNCGCPEHGAGGDGGALMGDGGTNGGGGFTPGGGASQGAGGGPGSNPGAGGALGVGGGTIGSPYHIGAGGGGYYGGGGAYAAGGGGGSSFYGNAMNASTMKGQRVGNGEIKISW
ncbi:MAG: hypothetical protein JNL82_12765 [Myxococcales bacterium]|nr:hypothetical protein [Myxococcales bacterium]